MSHNPTLDERLAAGERLVDAYEARIRMLRVGLRRAGMSSMLSADLRHSQAMDELRAVFYGELEVEESMTSVAA